VSADPHKSLRDDVRLLGELLGQTLRHHEGRELFERVERVRGLAKAARAGGEGPAAFDALAAELGRLPVSEALPVARAFAQFLNLANIAEQHHRVRRRRSYQRQAGARPQPASVEETLPRLLASGIPPGRLHEMVGRLRIELVLTAHPTEIMRRTLQQKYNRIAAALAERDRQDLTPLEREALADTLRREIDAAWGTEEVRRERPSPLDEVRSALTVVEDTVWDAVPQFLRNLDRSLRQVTGRPLSLEAAPVRFGSWIGGDRDGNPAVTPDITWRACLMSRWTAAELYLREIDSLRSELSMTSASDAVRARAGGAHEPYRAILRGLHQRLEATLRDIERRLQTGDQADSDSETGTVGGAPIESAEDLAEPLRLCFTSLHETRNGLIADGRLTDVLRRLAVFGVTLVRLDVRQDAARHAEAIDALSAHAGAGRFSTWDESAKVRFLAKALESERPIGPVPGPLSAEVADVFATCRTLARIHPESLGAYVITMASQPSDVLAVELLQREAGVRVPLRVVPLFETAGDLEGAGDAVRRLLAVPWYRSRLYRAGGRQEIMVGYSDSAKGVGRLAAAWTLYKAQEDIVGACQAAATPVTLFHGRGGSVGRGGGPTYLAIQSQPPGSVDGTLRVTEQGEMIQAKFGLPGIALRTLEVYTTATLEAALTVPAAVDPSWRVLMDRLAATARDAYRGIVFDDPRFLEYFHAATPIGELDALQIGSRPARRSAVAGFQSLRAIPWQFAWMQTRLLLATWLGAEEMAGAAFTDADRDTLRVMYRRWRFFRTILDLTEMALAKTDAGIASYYERQLVPETLRPVGEHIRERLAGAIAAVRDVTGHERLLADNTVLRRSIDVRNPYVDPNNVLQAELLRRLRQLHSHPDVPDQAREREEEWLRRALMVTMNGIAAGMRNTG